MVTISKQSPESKAIERGFKQITGSTGNSLFILEEQLNHFKLMKAITNVNMRLPRYQEALPLLMKDEVLKNALKDKWFFVAGKGLNEEYEVYRVNNKGELTEIKGRVSPEELVNIDTGKNPLSLFVYSDYIMAGSSARFNLTTVNGPLSVADVVVAVPKDWKLNKTESKTKIPRR